MGKSVHQGAGIPVGGNGKGVWDSNGKVTWGRTTKRIGPNGVNALNINHTKA